MVNSIEAEILKALNSAFSNRILDDIFSFISFLGNKGAVWIILALVLMLIPKTRKCGICAAVSLILCLIIGNGVLKPLFDRVRPYDFDKAIKLIIPALGDPSFPSGHTMAAFAVAESIRRYYKTPGIYVYIGAALMGLSRIYLCVHYPTDVIFGAMLGIVYGYASYKLISLERKTL
ncbi:MAG: phosphatase PAP2 family protein [Clostridia bacterium]|nr:phosphatase PAP2 family protein [Clostridia bacterium]